MPSGLPLTGAQFAQVSPGGSRSAFSRVLVAAVALLLGCASNPTEVTPDFTLTIGSTTITVIQGSTGTVAVALTRANFTEAVSLSLTGAPSGVTGTFDPASTTGTTSTLTLAVDASVTLGNYSLTVTGSGTPGTHSVPLTLTVAPVPDYALSVSPTALTVHQGASGTATVTLARTNFTGAVTLSVGGAPTGVSGSFSPAAPTGTSSTLTLNVDAATPTGVYSLTVDGAGTPGARSTALQLTVDEAPDFSVSLAPTALTLEQGQSGTVTVTLGRTNFTGAVTLALSGAPTGVTGTFAPAAPTGTSSTLTVDVDAATAPGTYSLGVDGTGTPGVRSAALSLTVTAAPNYSLSVSPTSLTIDAGSSDSTTVTLTRTNFTGSVSLSLTGAPTGVTATFTPASTTGTTSKLVLAVDGTVAPGTYPLSVDGTGTPGARSTALTLVVPEPPDYALSLSPTSLTIGQGASGTATVTLTRTNFTGAVTLSLVGAPSGVTGSFNPAAPTGTTSTLTVNVAGSVAPGTYNLTVDGAATPGARSTPLTLTVTAAPDYQLSLSPTSLSIDQGSSATTTVTLTRTNFTGAVTLSLVGAPSGVTGSFNPAAPTGTSSTLTVNVGGSVTPGTYNLSVDGSATPGARSTPLTLTVNAVGGATATIDFTGCAIDELPIWFASKDGAGAWAAVTGVGDVYTFTVASSTGGFAYALDDGVGGNSVWVQYQTKSELTAATVTMCDEPVLKSVTGSATGIAATDFATVSLGGGSAFPNFSVPNFQMSIQNGTHDLVGYRRSLVGGADAAIIRRDLDIPDGGSIAALDFTGVEAFAPSTATITLTGTVGGETRSTTMDYQVGATCTAATLYSGGVTGTSFTASGIPGAQQRASDYHALTVSGTTASAFRLVIEYFHTLANRTVALGASMPAPTVTSLGGPYERLQAVYTQPAEYNGQASFFYDDDASRSVTIIASLGYLGGSSVTLAMPDFSAVAGWSNAWAPASGSSGSWSIGGAGSNLTGSVCTENGRVVTAARVGTY